MSKGAHKFRQGDVTKAIRALAKSGEQGFVEIAKDGTIRVMVAKQKQEDASTANEWE